MVTRELRPTSKIPGRLEELLEKVARIGNHVIKYGIEPVALGFAVVFFVDFLRPGLIYRTDPSEWSLAAGCALFIAVIFAGALRDYAKIRSRGE